MNARKMIEQEYAAIGGRSAPSVQTDFRLVAAENVIERLMGEKESVWQECERLVTRNNDLQSEIERLRELCRNLVSAGDEIVWAIETMVPTAMKEERWKLLTSRIRAALGEGK